MSGENENFLQELTLIKELENDELGPLNGDIIVSGTRWPAKCIGCLQLYLDDSGEYAECLISQIATECEEGPFTIDMYV